MLKHPQNQEQRKLNQITNVTKAMSFVGLFFCLSLIAIALISSSNPPITNKNYYHAYAATVAEKQLQGANINISKNFSLPNLIRQGSPYLGEPTTAPITIVDFSDFQCYLCSRYVKATEPIINQTY
ncbi:MAG: hypothetical protein ACR2IS_03755, partial [Nitrososphaeraceae archaeon]